MYGMWYDVVLLIVMLVEYVRIGDYFELLKILYLRVEYGWLLLIWLMFYFFLEIRRSL